MRGFQLAKETGAEIRVDVAWHCDGAHDTRGQRRRKRIDTEFTENARDLLLGSIHELRNRSHRLTSQPYVDDILSGLDVQDSGLTYPLRLLRKTSRPSGGPHPESDSHEAVFKSHEKLDEAARAKSSSNVSKNKRGPISP